MVILNNDIGMILTYNELVWYKSKIILSTGGGDICHVVKTHFVIFLYYNFMAINNGPVVTARIQAHTGFFLADDILRFARRGSEASPGRSTLWH